MSISSSIARSIYLGLLACAAGLAAEPDGVSPGARQHGMQDAPSLIARSGISCHLVDARKAEAAGRPSASSSGADSITGGTGAGAGQRGGAFSDDDSAGGGGAGGGGAGAGSRGRGGAGAASDRGTGEPDVYEVACAEGLGYLLLARPKSDAIEVFSCPELSGPDPSAARPAGVSPRADEVAAIRSRCLLGANQNPAAAMTPYLRAAHVSCDVTRLRGVGHNASGTEFEVACSNGEGYLLMASSPPDPAKTVRAALCAELPADAHVQCQLSDAAASLAIADRLIAQAGVACTVTDRRLIGHNAAGERLYEVACQQGVGYMIKLNSDGNPGPAVSCPQLGSSAGGCKLAGNAGTVSGSGSSPSP